MRVNSKGALLWLGLLLALVLLAMMTDRGGSGAFDPRSVDPNGARGVVQVLEELGAEVAIDRSVPEEGDSAALLLVDRLTETDRELVMGWVGGGGVLVVADPFSPLAPDIVGRHTGAISAGECTLGSLRGAETLTTRSANLFARTEASCFGGRDAAHIVASPEGAGTVVTIGGPEIFTNATLDEADEAVVAVALLAPDPAAARVAFLGPSVVALGEAEVDDLVAPRVTNAVIQLIAAFVLYSLFRARRLGRVVTEPLPVRIGGSELVLGAGRLAERAKDPASTADVLRHDLIVRSQRAFGLQPDADAAELSGLIANAAGLDEARVRACLTEPITNEDDLVRTARELDVLHDRLFAAQEAK